MDVLKRSELLEKSNNKKTLPFLREQFILNGCVLLATDYKNSKTKMDFICTCGNESKITWNHFQKGVRCMRCAIDKRRQNLLGHKTSELTRIKVSEANRKRIWTDDMKSMVSKRFRNPNITDDDRLYYREKKRSFDKLLKQWRLDVFKRDDFKCVSCKELGCGNLIAHHKNCWSDFKEQRYLVDNGATLCENCHDLFHVIYGRNHNTDIQFNEFLTHISRPNIGKLMEEIVKLKYERYLSEANSVGVDVDMKLCRHFARQTIKEAMMVIRNG